MRLPLPLVVALGVDREGAKHVLGRASIEAVLRLSAEGIAGPPHPGRKRGAVGWHGRESGTVCLAERKLIHSVTALN